MDTINHVLCWPFTQAPSICVNEKHPPRTSHLHFTQVKKQYKDGRPPCNDEYLRPTVNVCMSSASQQLVEIVVINLSLASEECSRLSAKVKRSFTEIGKQLAPFWVEYKKCTDIKLEFTDDSGCRSATVTRKVRPNSPELHHRTWEAFLTTRLYGEAEDTEDAAAGKTVAECLDIEGTVEQISSGYKRHLQAQRTAAQEAAVAAGQTIQLLKTAATTRDTDSRRSTRLQELEEEKRSNLDRLANFAEAVLAEVSLSYGVSQLF